MADTKKIIQFFKLYKVNDVGIAFDTGNIYLENYSIFLILNL